MTNAECREEVKRCIAFYERRGWDWLSAVGFITFRHLFGPSDVIVTRDRWVSRPRVGRLRKKKP